ncbi:MAG: metallophosphoesterase [Acidobacteria bacterium]|nr:MAG: metallophosphoesterase [Acidobacteriota bacterium]
MAIAILFLLGLWAFWWEPSSLTVVHQIIPVRPWHPEHTGLKVAVMSDLHVGSPYMDLAKLQHVVAVTNAEKPDLIVILGDVVIRGVFGGRFITPEAIGNALAGLRAPLGIVAVLGNHDWWFDGPRVRHALESRGVRVLENESVPIMYRGKSFWLAGLADLWTRGNGLLQTMAKIDDAGPVLVLMHNPDLFPEMPERVSLTLAGHTHGGQVDLPIAGRLIVPSRFGQRYAYGLVEENGKKLIVTGGIGTSILPVRFRVPPEVVILTLIPQ